MQMVGHREGERLDGWLKQVTLSQIPEFRRLVRSINRDKAAVLAGLTLPCSQGQVEGQITKLKLIKRIVSWGFSFSVAEAGLKRLQNNVH